MKIKGILTDCITNEEKEVDLEYEIEMRDGRRIFTLLNGVTGWEGFYIDSEYSNLEEMKKCGWLACAGTPSRYNKLFIPAEEMQKALKDIEQTPISTLILEKQRELKNLRDQRNAKQRDINIIDISIEVLRNELGDKHGHI